MSKKTIAFDFDGVIHKYSNGWMDGSIYDEPVDGIKELIDELRKEYKIIIISTRCKDVQTKLEMTNWLNKYNIVVDDMTNIKVPAIMYIDDRGICFKGSIEDLKNEIKSFKTWHEKRKLL